MKKKVLMILAILAFMLGTSSANAAVKKGDTVSKKSNGQITTNGIYFGDNSSLSFYDYSFTIGSSNNILTGYCLDPNLHGATSLTVDRILLDPTDTRDEAVKRYDAALLAILKNGYSSTNTSFGGVSGNQLKAATEMAIRALTLGGAGFGRVSSNFAIGAEKTSGYINIGTHWISIYPDLAKGFLGDTCVNQGSRDAVKTCLDNRNKSFYGSWYKPDVVYYAGEDTSSEGHKVIQAASELFKLGLQAANEYVASEDGAVTVSEIESMTDDEPVLPETVREWKVLNFTFKNVSETHYVKNVKITCGADCAQNGFTLGRVQYKSGSEWLTLTANVDLSKAVDAQGRVQVRFEITKDLTVTGCTSSTYTLTYDENVSSGSQGVVGILAKASGMNTQRYVMLVENNVANGENSTKVFEGNIVCDGDDDDHDFGEPDPWDPIEPGDEPRKKPCRTKLRTPVCDYDIGSGDGDDNDGDGDGDGESDVCASEEFTYYTTTYITKMESQTYTYELKLKNQDAARIKDLKITSQSHFTSGLEDYDTYIRTRDQNIDMVGANPAYNSYGLKNATTFRQYALKNTNFTFTVGEPTVKKDDTGKDYYYVLITINVTNTNGLTPFDDPGLGYKINPVPLKFTVSYTPAECDEDETGNYNDGAISTDKNIKKCILENVDDAGNSYQLTTDDGIENRYCKVFCKEDYAYLKLEPAVKDVKCGGFFKLTAYVEGNKDCYTSGGSKNDYAINRPQYESDIKEAQIQMIEAMNEYLEAKAVLDHMAEDNTCPADADGKWSVREGYYTYYEYRLNDSNPQVTPIAKRELHKASLPHPAARQTEMFKKVLKYAYEDLNALTFREYTLLNRDAKFINMEYDRRYGYVHLIILPTEDDIDLVDNVDVENALLDAYYDLEGTDNYSFNYISQEDFDELYYESCMSDRDLKADLEEQMEKAEQKVLQAQRNMDKYVGNFNACTTDWTNDYNFDHTIRFEYSEPYDKLLSDNERIMEKVGEGTEKTEIEICTGTVNSEYECPIGEGYIFGDQDNSNIKDVLSHAGVIRSESYTLCDLENGCDSKDYSVSQAKYVRRSVYKSQDYITPTVFYQTEVLGKITTKSNYNGSSLNLEPLENKLPVATTTVGGGIFKMIVQDLGEFYDDGDLGRLIDFGGDRERESVAYAQKIKNVDTFDGNYVCYYESPCRPDDCPTCDFECEGEFCEWVDCPTCTFDCINCIFNLNELQLNFNSVSTNNFNSVDRKRGYNWDINTTIGILGEKASATIDEIINNNDTIFEDSPEVDENDHFTSNKVSDGSSLDFSIRMTSEVIKDLLEHNKSVEDLGGYANKSLTCYDYEVGGYEHKNLLCYSDKIDDLINKFGDQIITKNRTSEGMRATDPNADGYWTLWDGYVYSESAIGGPAWK